MRLLGECRGSIDTVKRMETELKDDEDSVSGLADPSSSESQTTGSEDTTAPPHLMLSTPTSIFTLFTSFPPPPGVIERWELLQAQSLNKEMRAKQSQQQMQQFNSDLSKVWTWLGEKEEELEQLRRLDLSTDIHMIEQRIKKLKVKLTMKPHCFYCYYECFN